MKMYCITISDNHHSKIKKFGYLPVGLGENILSNEFLRDNTKENICDKNPYYGEYTFHYWLWKNNILKNFENEWIGFCQYRKFWTLSNEKKYFNNLDDLNTHILKKIPESHQKYETILGEPMFVNKLKISKFLKKNLKTMITNPIAKIKKQKLKNCEPIRKKYAINNNPTYRNDLHIHQSSINHRLCQQMCLHQNHLI